MLSAQKRVRDDNDDEVDYAYFCKHKEEICRIIAERRDKVRREEALRREQEIQEASEKRQRERNARRAAEKKNVMDHLQSVLGIDSECSPIFKSSGGYPFFYEFKEACFQLWKYGPKYLGQVVLLELKPKQSNNKNEYFLLCLTDELSKRAPTTLPLCAKLVTKPKSATKKQWRNLPATEFKVSETDEVIIKTEAQIKDTMTVTILGKNYMLKEFLYFYYDSTEYNARILGGFGNMDGSKAMILLKKEDHEPVRSPDYSEYEQDDLDGDYSPRSPQYSPPEDDDSK